MSYKRSICIGFGLFEAIMAVFFVLAALQDGAPGSVVFQLVACAVGHLVLSISLLTGDIGYRD